MPRKAALNSKERTLNSLPSFKKNKKEKKDAAENFYFKLQT